MTKRFVCPILLVIFLVFSCIVFVAPFERNAVFWISYGFAIVAIGIQIPLWKSALKGDSLKSKFLGLPLVQIGAVFLTIQLVLSLLQIMLPQIPVWAPIILDTVVLGTTCICLISGTVARTSIEQTETRIHEKVRYIWNLKDEIDILLVSETDPAVKKALSSLSETIRYSDPISDSSLANIEEMIEKKTRALSASKDKLALISEIRNLLNQRNIMCKSLKISGGAK